MRNLTGKYFDAWHNNQITVQYTLMRFLCIVRVRKEGEVVEEKLTAACLMLVKDLDQDQQQQQQQQQQQLEQSVKPTSEGEAEEEREDSVYDIFISYAHRTPVEATHLYETLLDMDPNLKIFLDRSELKTGKLKEQASKQATAKQTKPHRLVS